MNRVDVAGEAVRLWFHRFLTYCMDGESVTFLNVKELYSCSLQKHTTVSLK